MLRLLKNYWDGITCLWVLGTHLLYLPKVLSLLLERDAAMARMNSYITDNTLRMQHGQPMPHGPDDFTDIEAELSTLGMQMDKLCTEVVNRVSKIVEERDNDQRTANA